MSQAALSFWSNCFIFALTIPSLTTATQCWYPDGQTEAVDEPCNPSASASACCNEDSWCMANGLCFTNGVVSRGSCTDRTWEDPACPSKCSEESTDAGLALQPCDGSVNPPIFACGTSNSDCMKGENTFELDDATGILLRGAQAAEIQGGSRDSIAILPSTKFNITTNGGNASSTAVHTVTATPSSESGYTAGQMAGVGAGVGVPLLIALLAAIFVIVRQRKQLQPLQASQSQQRLASGHDGYAYQPPNWGPQSASVAPKYSPMTSTQPQGHFRELDQGTPLTELDGRHERQEMGHEK